MARVPIGLSFAEAAAVPLAAQTALACLDRGEVDQDSRVAVIGAAGGVGTFVVQMARALGARVVGVASASNHQLLRSLGAAEVVDRRTTTLSEAYPPASFDVVVDCVGGRDKWNQAQTVLVPGGRFVTISRDEDGEVTPTSALRLISTIMARRLTSRVGRRIRYEPVFLNASRALLERVDTMISNGEVRPHVGAHFPLSPEGVSAALALSQSGRSVGKVVVETPPR